MNILIVSNNPQQAERAAQTMMHFGALRHRIDVWHNIDNAGLSTIYNRWMRDTPPGEAVVFCHQDVACDSWGWDKKVLEGLKQFDVIGIAGTNLLDPKTAAWWENNGQRHGAVRHRAPRCEHCKNLLQADFALTNRDRHCPHCGKDTLAMEDEFVMNYGAAPAECVVVDGLFIACAPKVARQVEWDEEFAFDFYDLAFCLRARRAGFKVGVIPLPLCHHSIGKLRTKPGMQRWAATRDRFVAKYSPL